MICLPRATFFKEFLKRFYLFTCRKRGREGERLGIINVWLVLVCPPLGTRPTTHACALTGNRTGGPLGSQASTQSPEPHHPGFPRANIRFSQMQSMKAACQLRKTKPSLLRPGRFYCYTVLSNFLRTERAIFTLC